MVLPLSNVLDFIDFPCEALPSLKRVWVVGLGGGRSGRRGGNGNWDWYVKGEKIVLKKNKKKKGRKEGNNAESKSHF